MTSAPSTTDIGFSGIRRAKSTSADQPVASAIGSSGTNARCHARKAASSTSATAARPASSVPSRRHGEDTAALASAASTGSPASSASIPAGGCRRSRMPSMTSSWRSSGMRRMPKASVAVRRSAVMTPCEKYGGTASSRPSICWRVAFWPPLEEVGQREGRAQLGLAAAALVGVAEALEHRRLVARHPLHDGGIGDARPRDDDVDLAADVGRALQRLQVVDRPVLGHELGQVGLHARLRLEAPAGDGDHERDEHDAARVRGRQAQRAAPDRGAAPAHRERRAVGDEQLAGAAPRRRQRPAAAGGRARRRAAAASAATPSVSAQPSASAMPATSSSPKPRTIGTGESARTRKPAAVAAAAVATVGAPRCAVRATAASMPVPGRLRLLHARLQLDRVVDGEPDEHGQHRDRGHGQRRAGQRQRAEGQPGRRHGDDERQQAQPRAEDQRQRERHDDERRHEQHDQRVADRAASGR